MAYEVSKRENSKIKHKDGRVVVGVNSRNTVAIHKGDTGRRRTHTLFEK